MPYCNIMDVRDRIPEVTSENVGDSDIVNFIAEADGYINDALRLYYDVPFTTVPTSVANLSAMWAAYIALTLYPDSYVAEDLERMESSIDSLISKYTSGKYSLGAEYELEASRSETYFVTSRPSKYDYFEVDQ